MNAIFFGAKRAFHSTLRLTRPWLRRIGLTAARFDLLWCIKQQGRREIRQSDLRRILGVTAATVSVMLRSLEDIGLITRRSVWVDKRQREIALTPEGLARVNRASFWLMSTGAVQLAVDSALARQRWVSWSRCFGEMEVFDAAFRRIRNSFGDTATLHYPWHPDD